MFTPKELIITPIVVVVVVIAEIILIVVTCIDRRTGRHRLPLPAQVGLDPM